MPRLFGLAEGAGSGNLAALREALTAGRSADGTYELGPGDGLGLIEGEGLPAASLHSSQRPAAEAAASHDAMFRMASDTGIDDRDSGSRSPDWGYDSTEEQIRAAGHGQPRGAWRRQRALMSDSSDSSDSDT